MRKQLMVMAVILIMAAVSVVADSPRTDDGTANVNRVKATVLPAGGGASRAVGTITYDNNTPFNRDGSLNGMVGNRFTDGVMDPHSIASVSFRVAGNYLSSVVMSIWDPNTVAGSAQIMTRFVVSGVNSGSTATAGTAVAPLTVPITGHNGSFIAGIRNTAYSPCSGNAGLNTTCDGVALTAGSGTPHAVRLNFTNPSFVPTIATLSTSGVPISGVNAIFRVTGDNLPVELMRLEVE
jgi:hypothetical protein